MQDLSNNEMQAYKRVACRERKKMKGKKRERMKAVMSLSEGKTCTSELRETGENICRSRRYRRGRQNQSHPEHREVFREKVGMKNRMSKHEAALVNEESGQ